MGKPLECIMGSRFVGRWVLTDKILIMLHRRSNVVGVNPLVIPLGSIVIKKDYFGTNGRHWCTVVIKDSMNLVVGGNQRVDPGWSNKVDNNVYLWQNQVPVFCWE